MNPEGRIRPYITTLLGAAMSGHLNGITGTLASQDIRVPDNSEHRDRAWERRYSLRSSSSGFARAKRAKSRL